jgi:uroporphyrinogen III methyltransferase/synthase
MSTAQKPLSGKKILITRAEEQAEDFAQRLRALGAVPIILPTITLLPPESWEPLDRAIRQLECYDWVIFTSVNGVGFFLRRLQQLGYPPQRFTQKTKIAAIGPATAQALQRHGLSIAFMPTRYLAEAIALGLGDIRNRQILLPRADIARKNLNYQLQNKGASVTEVVAYRTRPASLESKQVQQLFQQGIDIVTFTSASTVWALMGPLQQRRALLHGVIVACIGPIAARAAAEAGLHVDIVAREHTTDGLISAMIETPHGGG